MYRLFKLVVLFVISLIAVPAWLWQARLRSDKALMQYWFWCSVAIALAAVFWFRWTLDKSGVGRQEFRSYQAKQPLSKLAMLGMIFVVIRSLFKVFK